MKRIKQSSHAYLITLGQAIRVCFPKYKLILQQEKYIFLFPLVVLTKAVTISVQQEFIINCRYLIFIPKLMINNIVKSRGNYYQKNV